MKKILLTIFMVLVLASTSWAAAGSWSSWTYNAIPNSDFKTMSITATFGTGAQAGTVPNLSFDATTLAFIKGWFLIGVETDPGAVGPTNLYDNVINDVLALDIMGGTLNNRSSANTEVAKPKWYGTSDGYPPLDGTALTLVVSNNVVESSVVTYKFYLAK